jgi:CRP-like cAMP-binding protein
VSTSGVSLVQSQNLGRALSRLANQLGRKTRDEILIDAPITRQDLAEMTGTSPFAVSRTLRTWELQGFLRSKREQVIISDPRALACIGDDLPAQDKANEAS